MYLWRWLCCLGLLASVSLAWAQTTPNNIVTPQTSTNGLLSFVQGTGTGTANALQDIFTAGANGSRCNGMTITNTDTVSHAVNLVLESGGVPRTLVTVATVAQQGNLSGTPPLAPLTPTLWPGLPVDSNNNSYLVLKATDKLRAKFQTVLSPGAQIDVYVTCVSF
jgi:hypothetical protein